MISCPKCEEPTWKHFAEEKYYECGSCEFSVDYLVEDSYVDMLEQGYFEKAVV